MNCPKCNCVLSLIREELVDLDLDWGETPHNF